MPRMSGRFLPESDGSSGDPAGFIPIDGARVTVSLGGHTVASALSDADGRYAIASITPGTYDVRFSGALSDTRFKITISGFDAVVGYSSLDHAALQGQSVNSNVTAATRDHIFDFAHGIDRIDVSTIDANASAAGNAAFHWLGRAAFDGTRGALHFQQINRPGGQR